MGDNFNIPQEIDAEEFLYRGVVGNQWDDAKNRPSSALFKDSHGASVDRDALIRDSETCINALLQTKPFKAICRVKEKSVKYVGAIAKYLPMPENVFHCEIHGSEDNVNISDSKLKKLRDSSEVVFPVSE